MGSPHPDVSIVIPTKNGGELLREMLMMVRTQETDRTLEIVAVDSGSKDQTKEILLEHGARVVEIDPSDFDHGLTRNRAVALSRAPYAVLISQDAVPADAYWLEALLAPFQDPDVAGVYSRQLPRPGADALTRRQLAQGVTGSLERRTQRLPDRESYSRLRPEKRYELCAFDDVCSAIRRSVWRRIPYNSAYFAEDLDWGKRVLEAGWKIVYEPRSAVIHSHARSVRYEYKRDYLCHRRLYELFGLCTVPRLRDAVRNSLVAMPRDTFYIWRQEPRLLRRLGLIFRSPVLTLLSNIAQWRGAADERQNRPLPTEMGV